MTIVMKIVNTVLNGLFRQRESITYPVVTTNDKMLQAIKRAKKEGYLK